jgi:hypothetical protein
MRLASDPTGEFGDEVTLFAEAMPDNGFFVGGGAEHGALRSPDGRTIAFSYHTGGGSDQAGLHLVTFQLDP